MLAHREIEAYRGQGFLLIENALTERELAAIRDAAVSLVEASRSLSASDSAIELENGHSSACPRVRRIKQAHKQHPAFAKLCGSPSILEPVRSLIGHHLRLIGSKVNIKAARTGASVEWHQDWAFYPHTNEDVLAVGILLDKVTEDNAPLLLMPGSHHGPIYDHTANGMFAGGFDPRVQELDVGGAVAFTGLPGSISIHHARLVHGSAINRSERDRCMLFI